MKRLLQLSALILVILGLAWWFAPESPTGSGPLEIGPSRASLDEPKTGPNIPTSPPRVSVGQADQVATSASIESTLSIQVVDTAGKPLTGVPVGLRDQEAAPDESDLLEATTEGELGIARFERPAQHLKFMLANGRVFAHIDSPGFETCGEAIELAKLPATPVRLTLPPYGSIAVRVHDSAGEPVRSSWVELADAIPYPSGYRLLPDRRELTSTTSESGSVLFEFVALGREVKLTASHRFESVEAIGSGPRTAGEQVQFDLELERHDVRLIGRLVDEEARAIVECPFTYDLHVESVPGGRGGGGGGGGISTDQEGRFRMRLPRFKGSVSLRPTCPDFSESAGVRVNLDGRIQSERTDLGDIVIGSRRELASGHVVDDIGNPLSSAAIEGTIVQDASRLPAWIDEGNISGYSKGDGTFTAFGPRSAGLLLRLRAAKTGYISAESAEIVPGATGVWITLTRASRIEGTVILDEAGASARLWAHVLRRADVSAPAATGSEGKRGLVDYDGSFLIQDVLPGQCDVAIFIDGSLSPLATIDGVVLNPGEVSSDARLAAIDLRGRIAATAGAESKQQ